MYISPKSLNPRILLTSLHELSLQRMSNMSPKVSAHAIDHGQHNFMKLLFAPLDCLVQVQKKPDRKGNWDPHSIAGWHLRTSVDHHQMLTFYAKARRAERVSDAIFFKHKYLNQPTVSPEDAVVSAAHQLMVVLKGNRKGNN